MPIRLILFDLDGTLVNTSADLTNALNYALKPYGMKKLSVNETVKLVGEGISRLIEKALGNKNVQQRKQATEMFLNYYAKHLTDFSTIYPGVAETLEKLHCYKKAVISNKREDLSVKLLDDLGLLKFFDLIAGSDTTPEKKPSPVPVFYMLKKFHLNPDEAVIVGDSGFDIEAGKKAGIKTIAVSYGFREKKLLKDADYIIDKFEELPSVLDRNSLKLI
jgi:phosphoglycolate phosphatase